MTKKLLLSALFVLALFSNTLAQSSAEISPYINSQSIIKQDARTIEALWDVQFNYDLQAASGGSLGKAAVVYLPPPIDKIWVGYWNTAVSTYILVFNTAGVRVDSFSLPQSGWRCFTFDGTHVYGGNNTTTIQKIDPVTRTIVGTVPAPQTVRYLTYDQTANGGAGGMWLGNFSTNLQLISMTGATLQTWPYAGLGVTSIYGAAFDPISIGGPFLWLWGQGTGAGTPQNIVQVNPATGLPTGVSHDAVLDVGVGNAQAIAGGLALGVNMVPGFASLLGVLQGTPDRLFAYELRALDAGVLQPFNLTSPPNGSRLVSFPNSSTPFTITWDTSRANATYKFIMSQGTNVLLVEPTGVNNITHTLGDLDILLAGFGLNPGDSIIVNWDVWAFRNNMPTNDSLKSTNGPWTVTLKRGVPVAGPFNLLTPPNNTTIVTSVFNPGPVSFTWSSSGPGLKYRWKFGPSVENSETVPHLVFPSDGGGYGTSFTIPNAALDGILAGAGLLPGDSASGVWAVYASAGPNDSLKSVETWNITFKRQPKGENLIAYDSSSANGRICKDSVVMAMNILGQTFDLFNRGGNTSVNALPMRGYKRVIWLGTATSTSSPAQRDSLKAYMNNPPPTHRSKVIIFAEDFGYMHGRTGSTVLDLDMCNNYLGWNYVADRPPSGAAQGLVGDYLNYTQTDSTIGTWPDVLSQFDPATTHNLYRYRSDNTVHGIGKVGATWNAVTFATDAHALRRAVDSPPGSPIIRMLAGGLLYVDTDGQVPVELTSFTASTSGSTITLNWATATELNNKGFEIERKMNDGSFAQIGFVNGNGTTVEPKNYSFIDNPGAGVHIYRLKQVDFDGSFEYSNEVEVEIEVPAEFSLGQNYPNPFNPSTTINFGLAVDSKVTMKLFNTLGQEIATLVNESMQAGNHKYEFNGKNFVSGVYFYQIEARGVDGRNFSSIKKLLLLK